MADVDIRMKEIDAKEKGPQMGILHKTENPLEQALLSGGPTTQGHFDLIASEPFQLMQYFETESQKLDDDLNLLSLEITRLAYHSHRFGSYPYKRIERDYGEKIADIVSGFTFCDPYKMCFALLYLMDSDSDLPWLYYPGIVISENAGAMLPWFGEEYDEMEDAHWEEYYGDEPRSVAKAAKNVPELADWYPYNGVPRHRCSEYLFDQIRTVIFTQPVIELILVHNGPHFSLNHLIIPVKH